jgi:hypothetical protein
LKRSSAKVGSSSIPRKHVKCKDHSCLIPEAAIKPRIIVTEVACSFYLHGCARTPAIKATPIISGHYLRSHYYLIILRSITPERVNEHFVAS